MIKYASMTFGLPTSPSRWLCLIGIPIWCFLFAAGLIGYSGSKFVYLFYTLTFNVLMLSGLCNRVSYSYLFLSLFLWLGFWFKFCANYFLFGYMPFGEPVGYFDENSVNAWDHALTVAIVASLALMLGRLLYALIGSKSTMVVSQTGGAPRWYPRLRNWLWSGLAIGILILASLNSALGLQQSGLVPRTVMHWPLNALIYWFLSTGFSILAATLLWWDMGLRRNLLIPFLVTCGGAFFSTVSLLSRSTFVFHAVALLSAAYANWRLVGISFKRQALLVGVFLMLFGTSILGVSYMRDFYFTTPIPAAMTSNTAHVGTAPVSGHVPSLRLILLHQLIVNRWIGIEGVLAVSAYPFKSPELFFRELSARSVIGVVDSYQKISNSLYQAQDTRKFQFASLPGATAFFYYSGSLWYVFGGMLLLTLVSMFGERLVLTLTGNVFLCAIFGVNLANAIAQLGIAPRQLIPHLGMLVAGVVLIGVVQSRPVEKILARGRRMIR